LAVPSAGGGLTGPDAGAVNQGLRGPGGDAVGQSPVRQPLYIGWPKLGEIWHSDDSLGSKLEKTGNWWPSAVPEGGQGAAGEQRLDSIESSPLGAFGFDMAGLLGGGQHAQDGALLAGSIMDNGLAYAAAVRARAPLYMGAVRPPETPEATPPEMAYRVDPSKLGPSQVDIDSLVAEHSKTNKVPLTPAGAKAIIEQSQPPWTSVAVAGDNVKGADIYFPGSEGTHVQVKSVANADQFEEHVRRELRKKQDASPVIAVQVPAGTPADQLMGKLQNNFSKYDVGRHSIVVVDPKGGTVISKQPFPPQRRKP
jgi:hypothetical protein